MDATGFVAVLLFFAVPLAGIYVFYRVRKLRTEERFAAVARGVAVPQAEELPPHARSRRSGILLVAGGLGYMVTFILIGRVEPDAFVAAAFGAIPIALGIGFFVDAALVRRELHPTS